MAGFDNDTMYADNVDFSGSATPSPQVLLDGQLLIGSTATPHIKVNTLTAGAGITITNGSGAITIAATGGITPVGGLIPDAHTAPGTTPVVGDGSGDITITGAQVASGVVGANVIRTDSLAANTMTIEIQRSTAAAVATPADNGVSHFDSSIFSVDTDGFVSLAGGAIPPTQKFTVDANTAPGTNPVVATALGVITVSGAQVASGVVGTNVIRTNSTAANAYNIEIQRSAAVAASDVTKNGVSHFDSAIFTEDANGFVSLVGGSVPPSQKFNVDTSSAPGTDPVVPTASGVVTITGAQVASGVVGTNVIRTDSTAANSMTIEVQRSTAVAATDITKNGVCHFNNSQFSVDANGFVSSTVSPGGGSWTFIETKTAAASTSLTFNTSLSNYTELMFTYSGIGSSAVVSILMNVSADNGSTLISGTNNSGGAYSGTEFLAIKTASVPTGSGKLNIQNLTGTTFRIAQGNILSDAASTATNEVYNVIGSSAQLNWIKFYPPSGTFTGSINVYGR